MAIEQRDAGPTSSKWAKVKEAANKCVAAISNFFLKSVPNFFISKKDDLGAWNAAREAMARGKAEAMKNYLKSEQEDPIKIAHERRLCNVETSLAKIDYKRCITTVDAYI